MPPAATRRDSSERRNVLLVSELLAGVNHLLEDAIGRVWVQGEISNLHEARSGHSYFTLKDDGGQIRCALFRGDARRVPFRLEEGLEVLAFAEVSVYAARGDLQLIVRQLEPRGVGALQLAFEQLRMRLEAAGLFDPARKRAIPDMPRRIGIVASPQSAAIRDVLQVTGQRLPGVPILISPTLVQGADAAPSVAAALDRLHGQPDIDVVLLVRGGGSLEDLWAFNTEEVAHAIARAPWPVVSGVGHEVDVTIADLVADLRAPTPSAAAAAVLPDRSALHRQLDRDRRRLVAAMRGQLFQAGARLSRAARTLQALAPRARIAAWQARFDALIGRLLRLGRDLPRAPRARLAAAVAGLDALSPLAVLARGYAVARRLPEGEILRRADQVGVGDRISVEVSEARLEATVERVDARSSGLATDPET